MELGDPAVRHWDFPRSAASIALMVRFGEEHGCAPDRLLRGSRLTAAAVTDPATQVDARQELAVATNLVAALDRPGLGLDVGRRYRVATFGIFGFACITSPTLREAIRVALRFLDLSFTFTIPTVTVDGPVARMVLHPSSVPGAVGRFLLDRDLAAIYTVMTNLVNTPLPLGEVELGVPDDGGDYEGVLGVRPRFDRPATTATFSAALLDQPLPQADPLTVAVCEAQCRDLVERRRARSGVAKQVRERLVTVDGVPSGIAEVARELAMSERTLRRRLAEEGTSYRALLDEVREALAERLLETGALSVTDVAVRLGYSEATSFIAAFKRWTGATPAAYARGRGAG